MICVRNELAIPSLNLFFIHVCYLLSLSSLAPAYAIVWTFSDPHSSSWNQRSENNSKWRLDLLHLYPSIHPSGSVVSEFGCNRPALFTKRFYEGSLIVFTAAGYFDGRLCAHAHWWTLVNDWRQTTKKAGIYRQCRVVSNELETIGSSAVCVGLRRTRRFTGHWRSCF